MFWQDPKKRAAVREAAAHNPALAGGILLLSVATALLEGVGVGFILPIVEFTQSSSPATGAEGVLGLFVRVYGALGIAFTLEMLVVGVAAVMTVRFSLSFAVSWLRAVLDTGYQRALRQRLFEALAYGRIDDIDEAGSDDLLNSLLTETNQAGNIVSGLVDIVEGALRGVIYLGIAAILAPGLTLVAVVSLGASTLVVRYVLEPAYAVGDDIADVNEVLQRLSQAGIQGMRDVRLFTLRDELVERMRSALDQFFDAGVRLERNKAALSNVNQLMNSLVVFGLIYVGIRYTGLSLGEMGVFLFAIFRLSPTITQVNNLVYAIDGTLPHLVRVQERIETLESGRQDSGGGESIASVDRVAFDDVSFAYGDEPVLSDVSLSVERGEQIALVGQSGAGKSTVVSLLGRLQVPDSGVILADGTPIERFDVREWRERVAVVRQDPYVFDETLRENLTIGNRGVSQAEIERVCEIAQVTEFLPELPDGYESELGEDGVNLSGGQRQRVAIARALLKDADVLVFDEATSELDSNIQRDVRERIDAMDEAYAVIQIAHQLSTVRDADRIYTLESGTVTDVGTHEELLDSDGMYADLYTTQI